MEETTNAIRQSCEDQKKGTTTFIEVILNQELGEPFRRDAMKKPVKVAGVNKKDMSCLLYTSPSPRDISGYRMPSSA